MVEINILHKAIVKNTKNFVHGFFYKENNEAYIINENGKYIVDENTVCVFIGRKDENLKSIFTGDIIEVDKELKEKTND